MRNDGRESIIELLKVIAIFLIIMKGENCISII